MKKIISFVSIILTILVLVACDNSASSKPRYKLTLSNAKEYLLSELDDTYLAETEITVLTVVPENGVLTLYLNEEKLNSFSTEIAGMIFKFSMPNKNSVLRFEYQANAIEEPAKKLSDYVELKTVNIPTEFFTCEMKEVAKEDFVFPEYNSMICYYNYYNYEYGYLSEFIVDETDYYSSNLIYNRMIDEVVYTNKHFISYGTRSGYRVDEVKSFSQQVDLECRGLTESDDGFSISSYTTDSVNPNTFIIDVLPSLTKLLNSTDLTITYEEGTKDDYKFISVSSSYQDLLVHKADDLVYSELIYVFSGNDIIAWLSRETLTDTKTSTIYSTTTEYAIPYSGDVTIFDLDE